MCSNSFLRDQIHALEQAVDTLVEIDLTSASPTELA